MTVDFSSPQLILARFSDNNSTYTLGFAHASNSYLERRTLWADITSLGNTSLCIQGDFNAWFSGCMKDARANLYITGPRKISNK